MAEDCLEDLVRGLEKGLKEFNEAYFFRSHDTWEETWHGVRGEDRLFLQGMIQLAIAYYHLTCENYPGAEHLLTRGIQKLQIYLPVHRDLNLEDLVDRASDTLAQVIAIRAGNLESYDPNTIPKIMKVS